MSMTHKARLAAAFRHAAVDRLPTQINYTAAMGQALAAHYRVSGQGTAGVPRQSPGAGRRDSRPALQPLTGWCATTGGAPGTTRSKKATSSATTRWPTDKDLDAYPWPDPHAPGLLDDARADHCGAGRRVLHRRPTSASRLFERAWSLRGFEQFLMDMAQDPGYAAALLDRITEIQLALIERFLALGVDGGYFGDDYGAQKGLLFSPATWRKLIKPRLARLFAPFRAAGLPVIMHSDGQIQPILPDLVEIGLTVLNPVQPEVLNHRTLRREFGDKLAFYGGISTQTVLPHGTPAEVRRAWPTPLQTWRPQGTGLLLAPSHRMMADIPLANVDAMLAAFRESLRLRGGWSHLNGQLAPDRYPSVVRTMPRVPRRTTSPASSSALRRGAGPVGARARPCRPDGQPHRLQPRLRDDHDAGPGHVAGAAAAP